MNANSSLIENRRLLLKSFLMYLLIVYTPGMIFYPFFIEDFQWYYSFLGPPYLYFFVAMVLFVVPFSFLYFLFGRVYIVRLNILPVSLFNVFVFLFLIVLAISSVYFFLYHDSSFRHKSRLTNAGILVSVMYLIKPWAKLITLIFLIRVLNGRKLEFPEKLALSIILLSMSISISASLDIVFLMLLSLMIFWPSVYVKPYLHYKIYTKLAIAVAAVIVCVMVLIVGIGNKVGYSKVLSSGGVDYMLAYMSNIAPRVSSSLFSAATLVDCCLISGDTGEMSADSIVKTFKNRFGLIFYGEFDSNAIDTINRANYLTVFNHHAERAGASPGVFASQIYTPFYPLSFLALPLFYVMLLRVISDKIKKDVSYSIVSIVAIGYLLMDFFESPLDVLYVFTPLAVNLFLFIFLFLMFSRRRLFYCE